MKKVSALVVSIAFLLVFPLMSHAEGIGDRLMYKGEQGADVHILQNLLQSKGYFRYPEATGYFGPITEQAVKDFQNAHGLKVDGIAGPHTLFALRRLYRGLNGTSVKNLQEQLKELGYYHYRVTGIFGPITEQAVKDFQSAMGLPVTGKAGPHTLNELHQRAGSPVSENGDQKERITVSSTSYTANCSGCSGITKSGVDLNAYPDAKVVAVDPLKIPLGSEVYVPGYGLARAVDSGAAIDGNEIDVFLANRSNALDWGRKTLTVTVLK
ncbi:MAG TPA: peptidoglycan-binding protein [Bacillales bacterium]|nr:peptidoglycan-binding protein [Bacillales bacterium]